jgi:2-methylcitrate dehydratase PrpD
MTDPAQPSAQTLLSRLLDEISRRPVTDTDLEKTALFVVDALGGILGAVPDKRATPILSWAAHEPNSPSTEAFIFGALSTVLEMDAMHNGAGIHPGTVIVPAALSVARATQASGRQLLTAILKGCEVSLRIGLATGSEHRSMYQPTSTCGAYGAALASGYLMSLDDARLLQAMATAGTAAGGLWEFIASGAMSKQWHAGRAAQAGVASAQLAQFGFTGPPAILEGGRGFFATMCADKSDASRIAAAADQWELFNISYKPWPSPRPTHPAIDAALGVKAQLGDRPVARIEVDTFPFAVKICSEPFRDSAHAARFSLPYCVAAALTDGDIDFRSFDDEARSRHGSLAERVAVAATADFAERFPASCGAEIRVLTTDGEQFTCRKIQCKGDPLSPMSKDELTAKARRLLSWNGEAAASELIQDIFDLLTDRPLQPVGEWLNQSRR